MNRILRDGSTCEGGTLKSVPSERWRKNRGGEARGGTQSQALQPGERLAWLAGTIEAEIIPRLMLAHRPGDRTPAAGLPRAAPGTAEVEAFARIAVRGDAEAAAAHVTAMRAEGVALETIYLRLLAPAARHLGELWQSDAIDFTEVTTGLWRLQQVMYDLSPAFQRDGDVTPEPRRALLAPAPGSQHTFGLLMVSEFFQRAGWDVWTEPSVPLAALADVAHRSWFDLIGLSCGSACQLQSVTASIVALRAASLNPSLGVMVGGPVFVAEPELAAQVGADATATDAAQALAQAEHLVRGMQKQARRARS